MLNNQQQIPQIQIPQKEIEQIPYQEPEKSKYEKLKEFISTCPFTISIILSINVIIIFFSLFCYGPWFAFLIRNFIIFFAWAPLGKKIENSVGSGRYICLSLLNMNIVFLIYIFLFPVFRFYFSEIFYNFAYFEMLLVSLSNKDKHILFFNKKIPCKFIIYLLPIISVFIIYHHIYFILTYIYGWIYYKYLTERVNFTDEKIKKLESFCIFKLFVKSKRYVKLPEVNDLIDASIQINMNGFNNNVEVHPQQVVINNNPNQINNITNNTNEFVTPGFININQP